jgi:hypothetical protein
MAEACRVFWGSHGCDLPRGHPPERHQCGLDEDDENPPCTQVERELDEVTGTELWVQRFAEADGGWGDPFPAWISGEDLPPGLTPSDDEVDALSRGLAGRGQDGALGEREGLGEVRRVGLLTCGFRNLRGSG